MSHYAVAVFADNPDDFDVLLAPYNENDHLVATEVDEESLRERYDKFLEQNTGWRSLGFEYWLEQMGYKRENGGVYTYHNPNAKWDWYTLDGKDYLFELKPGAESDDVTDKYRYCYRKNDYDYHRYDKEDVEDAARFWEIYIEGRSLADGEEEPETIFTKEYYLERYGDKETYIEACAKTRPYAFITPDGVWHAPGDVGYFAVDDSTAESLKRYNKEWDDYIASNDNPYVSFVDCHI